MTQTDKPNTKPIQQLKTTPLNKIKLMQPVLSINRLHTPSKTQTLPNVRFMQNFILFLSYTTHIYLHVYFNFSIRKL